MIGSLRGFIIDRDTPLDRAAQAELLLEVSGVGYRVTVTADTLDRLVAIDGEIVVHIHHHIREADQRLYGFMTKHDRVAFEGLLAAHGVGPALAMAVMATHSAPALARILADDDLAALCEVPGVGKKTAQRLLVELKSSLVLPVLDAPANGHSSGANTTATPASPVSDVREALTSLGYSSDEIRTALASLDTEAADADAGRLLKSALRALAAGG